MPTTEANISSRPLDANMVCWGAGFFDWTHYSARAEYVDVLASTGLDAEKTQRSGAASVLRGERTPMLSRRCAMVHGLPR